MSKRPLAKLFLLALLLGTVSSLVPRSIHAANNALIVAPTVIDLSLGPGNLTTFAINASKVGPAPEVVSAWQLFLHLNATLLQITQVIEGPALSDVAMGGTTLFTGKFNATTGLVQTDDILIPPQSLTGAGMVGNGTLVYVKAKVLAYGTTDLVLNNTKLYSINGTRYAEVNHTPVSGIFSNVPYNFPPVASFTMPSKIVAGGPAHFNASASHDPDGSIVKYYWNFGDGNATSVTVPTIDHTYANPGGPLKLNLTVTDNGGASNSKTATIYISRLNLPPIALFTFSPANPRPGEIVTFNDTASYDPDGDPLLNPLWTFSDGRQAGGKVVTHIFNQPDNYTVTLTATDSFHLTGTTSKTITVRLPVNAPPPPDFALSVTGPVSFTSGTSGTSTITVTAQSGFERSLTLSASMSPATGLFVSFSPQTFQYGSGSSTATFTSTSPGTYIVTMTGTSGALVRSQTVQVTVNPAVQPTSPAPTILGLDPTLFYALVGGLIAMTVIGSVGIVLKVRKPPASA